MSCQHIGLHGLQVLFFLGIEFPCGEFLMSRKELERELVKKTGESVRTIRRRGFSIVNVQERDFDPEPNLLPAQIIDWDQVEAERRVA